MLAEHLPSSFDFFWISSVYFCVYFSSCEYWPSQARLVWAWCFNACPKLGIAESSSLQLSHSMLESLSPHVQRHRHRRVSPSTPRPHSLPSSWCGPPGPSSSQLTDPLVSPVSSPDLGPLWYVHPKPLILLTGYTSTYTMFTQSGLSCKWTSVTCSCRREQINTSVLRTEEIPACPMWDLQMLKKPFHFWRSHLCCCKSFMEELPERML